MWEKCLLDGRGRRQIVSWMVALSVFGFSPVEQKFVSRLPNRSRDKTDSPMAVNLSRIGDYG